MGKQQRLVALAGAATGLAAGIAAERLTVRRRHDRDPEAGEAFGTQVATRSREIHRPDGAVIFVAETGSRATRGVVFVHGSALRLDQWHYQMRAHTRRRQVFFDLRGHGRSRPKGTAPFTIATFADDLLAVIEESGMRAVVIVGHSLGGMVALHLCCARPDLLGETIKGLVLSNTTYRHAVETIVGGAALARLERATRRPFDLIGSHHERIDHLRRLVRPSDALFWTVSFAGFGPRPSARQVDFTYDMLSETPSDVIFDLFTAYRDFDVSGHLAEVSIPALVVAGRHDRITVPEAGEYLAERLPKAQLRVLEDCGHMAMMEKHHEFNEMLEGFLNDALGRLKEKARRRT